MSDEVGTPMRCPRCFGRGYQGRYTPGGKWRFRTCPRCEGRGEVIRTRPIRYYLVNLGTGGRGAATYWRNRKPIGWGDKRGATRFTNEQRTKLETDAAKLGTTVGGVWQEC